MTLPTVRDARADDLAALTAIYNHYIVHTPITFDLKEYDPEQRRPWLEEHQPSGRHRLLVATDDSGILGYASTSRWRAKAAYDPTVETSVYVRHDAVGRGIGSTLYTALFDAIATEDVNTIVAGMTLPNDASRALHAKFGFREVGVFSRVGRKFGRYWDVGWFQRPLKLPSA
jgi:phosphinothricin acetyltransferase